MTTETYMQREREREREREKERERDISFSKDLTPENRFRLAHRFACIAK